jgi:hypothetical protein
MLLPGACYVFVTFMLTAVVYFILMFMSFALGHLMSCVVCNCGVCVLDLGVLCRVLHSCPCDIHVGSMISSSSYHEFRTGTCHAMC